MAIVITIANQKGGIGKTTTVINISDALNRIGYKVLTLDMDPQCNTTSQFDAKIDGEYTMHDILMDEKDEIDVKETIQHTKMGDIIPGDYLLANDQYKLMQNKAGHFCLKKKVVKKLENDYDFIVIDTPPTLGILMTCSLVSATGLIIPLQAEKYSLDGLSLLIDTVNDVIDNINPELEIYGTLITEYDQRNNSDKEMAKQLPVIASQLGMRNFRTPIRKCQEIRKASACKESLFDFAPKCNAVIDYTQMVKELLEVIENG